MQCTKILAAAAGLVLALGAAFAKDGVPDLSGAWSGAAKIKERSFDPEAVPGPSKSGFTVDFAQSGGDLTGTFVHESDPPVDLSGFVGNGTFWAFAGDPASPMLISGQANKPGTGLKGGVLVGNQWVAADGKFKAARSAAMALSSPRRPLLAPAVVAASPKPDVSGAWAGTMSGKFYSLETGGKPAGGKVPVSLTATVVGDDATLTLTLHKDSGDELIPMSGKSANGTFWAYNGDPGNPVVIVGTISGKAPRLKLKARGVHAGPTEASEVTLSLKQSPAALLGTAAAGAAIADATVTLKDRNGTSVTAVTGDGGGFVLDAAGLTPPFLLKVDLPAGGGFYGVATEAGVANLHPLTDLILRTWYGVKGLDLATSFATLGPSTPMPTAVEVELLEGLVRRAIQKWLVDRGIDPATFDLIQSAFAADGTGFDAILDGTTVAPDGSSLTITDGTTTQNSDFTLSSVSGTVTVDTTVTSPAGTSASRDGTVLTFDSAMQEAVAGAMAVLETFRAKINARGAALTASDLAPLATSDYLGEGLSRTLWSAQYATIFRGGVMEPVALRSVVSFDPDAGILVLDVALTFSAAGESGTHRMRWSFKKSGPAWLLYGDRKVGEVRLGVECRTDYRAAGVDGPRRHIQVDVTPPVGTVQSVTISGGGVFSGNALTKSSQTRLETFRPTPSTQLDMEWDMFYIGLDVVTFPAPGTEFQITVKPASGPDIVYTVESGATTTESVTILQPAGNSLATDAHPGTPLTARWTRPTTFAVDRLEFSGSAYSADFALDVPSDSPVSTTAAEGTVTIPPTAGGQTVITADFYLAFEGPNGELIVVQYLFE